MAVRKKATRKSARRSLASLIKRVLTDELARAGIPADVVVEPIRGTKLNRVTVVAGKFARLRFSERQAIVWKIIDQEIEKDDHLFISMVYTFTPDDVERGLAA